jgi:serine phosphatase RsbU (regulator of sigma subunit)
MVFILDTDGNIISLRGDLTGEQLRQLLARGDIHGAPDTLQIVDMFGQWHYWMYDSMEAYHIVAALPQQEVLSAVRMSAVMIAIMGVLLFAMLYAGIRLLVERVVVRQVNEVADTLSVITAGNLDAEVSVRSTREFDIISDGINATVSALKEHIAREAARIDAELGYASLIQQSALPALTEPFTSSPAFELYACMSTAKEVGGDFYDFYMLDDHTLAFLVADVSGKGIPAAMFMMTGKAILRNCVEHASGIGEGFVKANKKLCARNDAFMFITAWMGLLDLETGEVTFANAGHTPPILIRDGKAAYLKMESNIILAIMGNVKYQSQRLKLRPSDVLYLYTDGVTEAVSAARELYGEDRLLQTVDSFSSGKVPGCEALCRHVADSIDLFEKGEPQADDITMLCLRFRAPLKGTPETNAPADGMKKTPV